MLLALFHPLWSLFRGQISLAPGLRVLFLRPFARASPLLWPARMSLQVLQPRRPPSPSQRLRQRMPSPSAPLRPPELSATRCAPSVQLQAFARLLAPFPPLFSLSLRQPSPAPSPSFLFPSPPSHAFLRPRSARSISPVLQQRRLPFLSLRLLRSRLSPSAPLPPFERSGPRCALSLLLRAPPRLLAPFPSLQPLVRSQRSPEPWHLPAFLLPPARVSPPPRSAPPLRPVVQQRQPPFLLRPLRLRTLCSSVPQPPLE
mmetsp:Transcript_28634/g.71894  ORF Transcript_28634/g.71894 Transcript_28634/m.71894 type:complete len:258 (-) Transcript_28634:713-1486(-)